MGINSSQYLNMETPNHFEIINAICNDVRYKHLLVDNSNPSITKLMQIIGTALKDKDPNWGYLSKTEGEKHLTLLDGRFIAVDSFIYKSNNQVVDVLSNAVELNGDAAPTWQFRPKRDNNHWLEIEPGYSNENDMKNLAQLEKEVAELKERLTRLEACISGGVKATIQSHNGKFLCAEGGGPSENNQSFHFTSRDQAGSWEQFEIKFQTE